MRKYVKPRAKFHELKGTVILAGSGGVKDATIKGSTNSVTIGRWSNGNSYDDSSFVDE